MLCSPPSSTAPSKENRDFPICVPSCSFAANIRVNACPSVVKQSVFSLQHLAFSIFLCVPLWLPNPWLNSFFCAFCVPSRLWYAFLRAIRRQKSVFHPPALRSRACKAKRGCLPCRSFRAKAGLPRQNLWRRRGPSLVKLPFPVGRDRACRAVASERRRVEPRLIQPSTLQLFNPSTPRRFVNRKS